MAFVFATSGSQDRGPDVALDLDPEVLDLERTAARHGIVLDVAWWPRQMNTVADARPKIAHRGNYALSRAAFAEVEWRFGPHTIDRFTDDRNALLPRFNSHFLFECASRHALAEHSTPGLTKAARCRRWYIVASRR